MEQELPVVSGAPGWSGLPRPPRESAGVLVGAGRVGTESRGGMRIPDGGIGVRKGWRRGKRQLLLPS
jgi:hypothetical protein